MNEKKHHKNASGWARFLGVLLTVAVVLLGAITLKGCLIGGPLASQSNYEKIRQGVRALIESQSCYCLFKTDGKFADGIAELGYTREGGEITLREVWQADYSRENRVSYEGYFFTTFALDGGKLSVIAAVPEERGNPYFLALYGDNGVSMVEASATPIFMLSAKSAPSRKFLSGETTQDEVRGLISKAVPVTAESFSSKN